MQQLALDQELIIDNFAGGGGASTGIERAFGGRPVNIAINHDPEAVALHQANHPYTEHFCESVFEVNPAEVCKGRPVGLVWLSPDCKHHSKARGGKPVEKSIRGLAWVATKWAGKVRPRVIMLENVEEFKDWGPLVAKKKYRRHVPLQEQELVACQKRRGKTFKAFVKSLQKMGYTVEWQELKACDYGAPTIRKRLFLIARCDGQPIIWPTPTHGTSKGLLPFKTAADIIDWSLPCPSIFDRKKPLVPTTLKRVAKGVKKFVIDAAKPFVIPIGYGERKGQAPRTLDINQPLHTVVASSCKFGLIAPYLTEHANASNQRNFPADEPLRTQCAQVKGGHFAIVTPHLSRQFGCSTGSSIEEPCGTVMPGGAGKTSLVAAHLAQHNTGVVGREAGKPLSTITSRGTQQALVTANLLNLKGSGAVGTRSAEEPLAAVCANGTHAAVVTQDLEDQNHITDTAKAEKVIAFMTKYYSSGDNVVSVETPAPTLTTKDRLSLVLVKIGKQVFQIVDIGMRMLSPAELYQAQGFPKDYVINLELPNGKQLTKTAQVRMCGNSVCPPVAEALVRANFAETQLFHREAAE